jgi:hypothetical protein
MSTCVLKIPIFLLNHRVVPDLSFILWPNINKYIGFHATDPCIHPKGELGHEYNGNESDSGTGDNRLRYSSVK